MRVDLKKILFLGLKSDQKNFFSQTQELGIVHFIDGSQKKGTSYPQCIEKNLQAIKILQELPQTFQEVFVNAQEAEEAISSILDWKYRREKLSEEIEVLEQDLHRIAPLGDFCRDEIKWIERESNRSIQFFCCKSGIYADEQCPELLHVATENNVDYFVSISLQSRQYPKMQELELVHRSEDLQIKYSEDSKLRSNLESCAKYLKDLQRHLTEKINQHHSSSVSASAEPLLDNSLFTISGWVPENKVGNLRQLSQSLSVHMEEAIIHEEDNVPTYLHNQGLGKIGEDLVKIYDVPSKNDSDPSLWVLIFFALFFAVIVGDAGYGIFLLLIGYYIRRTYPTMNQMGKRMLNLLFILGGSVVVWGVLTVSFFGITFAPDNPVRSLSPLSWLVEQKTAYHFSRNDSVAGEWHQKFPELAGLHSPIDVLGTAIKVNSDTGRVTYEIYNTFADNLMMELAVLIGLIHLVTSLLRYVKRHIAAIGWVAFLFGGYLYCPPFMEATSIVQFVLGISSPTAASCGMILMSCGVGFAMIFNFFKQGLAGLIEGLSLVVQIFSDSMSYLRLYALGLSGALITTTVNELVDGMPVILVALILTITHLVNFVLAIMGATIHGLRLNFLEWYHYSFEGGGKPFSPLKKMEIGD